MKRILILFAITILAATQCTHPYDPEMMGSFPYFEMITKQNVKVQASNNNQAVTFDIKVRSSLNVEGKIEYNATDENWLNLHSSRTDLDGTTIITYKAEANLKRSSRQAKIKLIANEVSTGYTIIVEQAGYEVTSSSGNVFEGDLYLYGQEEVNNCIYTEVTGNLNISGEDITDLSPLNHLKKIGGGLGIHDCQITDLGPLTDKSVSKLELQGTHSENILKQFIGNMNALLITDSRDEAVDMNTITRFADLEGLEIFGNKILNLTKITKLKKLQRANFSEVTKPELNYLSMLMPGTEFYVSDYQSSFHLEARKTADSYTNMYVYMSFRENPTLSTVGYILSQDGTCDITKLVAINDWAFNTGKEFTITNLASGTDYTIWLYAVSADGRYFLSEPETFTTIKVDYYQYRVDPIYPCFENKQNETFSYPNFGAYMYKVGSDAVMEDLVFTGTIYSTQEATLAECSANILMYAPASARSSYEIALERNSLGHTWKIALGNAAGSDSDLVIYNKKQEFNSNITEEVNFTRPVARVYLSVDLSNCVGSLDDIQEIRIDLDGFYKTLTIDENGSKAYTDEQDYLFIKETVSPTGVVAISGYRYVMPSITDKIPTAVISLKSSTGQTYETSAEIPEGITANNSYDIKFNATINRFNGTFTVDQVEVVEGGRIEF